RHLGLAEAADADHGMVAFVSGGRGAPVGQADGPGSVEAPDFTLPDLDGNLRSLSDYRGRKVVVLAWGSY
ncbi:MAG TPA: redoxin domain-containing protein, partial [Acidimicrobiia bacterium]